ncbi:MAG: fumarate hydratase, partial [Paracoccaceae bacterium]
DMNGDCLFERENAKIAGNIERLYEGTKPAVMKRYGESDDRSDEVI